jgi:hypothetical protein
MLNVVLYLMCRNNRRSKASSSTTSLSMGEDSKKARKKEGKWLFSVYMCVSVYYSYLTHRPLLALAATLPPAGALGLIQPRASASCCCRGIVTATVTTTTPSNASAATMAIVAIDVVVVVISLVSC